MIFNSHLCKYVVIDLTDGPSLVIYGHALPFTTNSTFLTIVNKNIYNKKFPNQLYIQRKSHVCYIQSCYIANTCTERVTHFGFSSGRHKHACAFVFGGGYVVAPPMTPPPPTTPMPNYKGLATSLVAIPLRSCCTTCNCSKMLWMRTRIRWRNIGSILTRL